MTKKYICVIEVNEKRLRDSSDEYRYNESMSTEDCIFAESGWLEESGIEFISVTEV